MQTRGLGFLGFRLHVGFRKKVTIKARYFVRG